MQPHFRETTDKEEFESLLPVLDYPFTQSFTYGTWHESVGRKVRRYACEDAGRVIAIAQIIEITLPFGRKVLYVPHGPICSEQPSLEFWQAWQNLLMKLLVDQSAMFARFDVFPPQYAPRSLFPLSFEKVPGRQYTSFMQPEVEWHLALTGKTLDQILAQMHPKMRYNMGLAQRRGLETRVISQDLLEHEAELHSILSETAKRDHFYLHPREYYRAVLANSERYQSGFLVQVRLGKEALALLFVFVFGKTANFAFGGARSRHLNLMGSPLAHKAAVEEALRRGCSTYNLGGVVTTPRGSLAGLSAFKQRFGGNMFRYGNSYDVVHQPFWYALYRMRGALISLWR